MSDAKSKNNDKSDNKGAGPTRSFDGSTPGPGGQIGPFRIERELGRGGAGVVYLAHDTKLNRHVAIKSLPAGLKENPKARTLFAREAKVLASLNHPNIATIYEELQEAEGSGYLVLEYVPGQTLAERIAGARLKPQEALSIAQQIAEAVAAAHEHDVIHRDLKPGNIKITPEGNVKVLDFGLAKALGGKTTDQQTTITEPGRILGTPAYMSPEQARGQKTDKRCDIWSFGCMLYEMLTGKVPFKGETFSDTLAGILEREPDWNALPQSTPANIKVLLRRCLEKDPRQRLRDIGDASIEIHETLNLSAIIPTVGVPFVRSSQRTLWKVAVLCVFACLVVGIIIMLVVNRGPKQYPEPKPLRRYSIMVDSENPVWLDPESRSFPCFTPDGSQLIYVAGTDTNTWLSTRSLDSLEAQRIPGTEGASLPQVSPGGRWLAFTAKNRVWKIPLIGGTPEEITDNPFSLGYLWENENTLILSTKNPGVDGISRFDIKTGKSEPLTTLDTTTGYRAHWPTWLDLESRTLFFVAIIGTDVENWALFAMSLDSHQSKLIMQHAIGTHVLCGRLIYAQKGRLVAAPFDTETLQITGDVFYVTEDRMATDEVLPNFTFSSDGALVYVPTEGLQRSNRELVWVDFEGQEEPVGLVPMMYQWVCMSGDRDHPKVAAKVFNDPSIWIYDIAGTSGIRPLIFSSKENYIFPVWMPPGNSEIIFVSEVPSPQLYQKADDGSGQTEILQINNISGWTYLFPHACTPDGNVLLAVTLGSAGTYDIVAIHLDRDCQIEPLLASNDNETHPVLSPNGKWMAYVWNKPGRSEIFVTSFPELEGNWPVSSKGGWEPLWAPDGKAIYYRDGTSVIEISVDTEKGFRLGETNRLFDDVYVTGEKCGTYAIHTDGKRFLMMKEIEDKIPITELIIVENWFEELKRHVPTGKK